MQFENDPIKKEDLMSHIKVFKNMVENFKVQLRQKEYDKDVIDEEKLEKARDINLKINNVQRKKGKGGKEGNLNVNSKEANFRYEVINEGQNMLKEIMERIQNIRK